MYSERYNNTTGLIRYVHWYDNGMDVVGANNNFVIGFKASYTRSNHYQSVKWTEMETNQESVAKQVIDPEENILLFC